MKNRDIAVSIIFTLITCGIYGIFWFIVLTDEIANVSEDHSFSGGMSFLFTLITCGIYGIYWAYKMGTKLEEAKSRRGMGSNTNMPVVYLVLQIFGLGIINYALMQSDLNNMNR